MSLPQTLDIISIPIVAGVVGYVTNKLAITMLFRPYYPKWYTFGWQGIVPRSRGKLASLIGHMVANKLLSPDDVASSVIKKGFTENVSKFIESKLENLTSFDIENALQTIDFGKIFNENKEYIDNLARKIILEAITDYFDKKLPIEKLAHLIKEEVATDELTADIAENIAFYIKNKINSDGKLSETLPNSLLAHKTFVIVALADKTANMIKTMGRSMAVKEAAAERIVDFKNSFFSGNGKMDFLKMGFVNMVLGDETVSNAVKRELPGIMDGIADDENVKRKIYDNIESEIDAFLSSPLKEIIEKNSKNTANIGAEIESFIASPKTRRFISESLSSIIDKYEIKYKDMIVGDAIKAFGFDIEKAISGFSLCDALTGAKMSLKSVLCDKITVYVSNNAEKLTKDITGKVENLLRESLPSVIKNADISGTVEAKINAMPLSDVENVLFSFMRDHFKWINRLGFILGFLIGALQVATIYFLR